MEGSLSDTEKYILVRPFILVSEVDPWSDSPPWQEGGWHMMEAGRAGRGYRALEFSLTHTRA